MNGLWSRYRSTRYIVGVLPCLFGALSARADQAQLLVALLRAAGNDKLDGAADCRYDGSLAGAPGPQIELRLHAAVKRTEADHV